MKFSCHAIRAIQNVKANGSQVLDNPGMFRLCSGKNTDWSKALWGCFVPFTDGTKYNKTKYRLDEDKLNILIDKLQVYLKSLEQ